ncbi:MutS-related protein [Mucilaginibacter sp. UYCu711]|uniref:MutS-related protein n=1 Tax=Mucilaginibacter sp. UYCu711 TaxID=3156339 RepID=UPI003D1DB03E
MLFTTDQQTIEDLNIFGKHSRASIYTLFNHTHTRGAADLLEEMFRFPLSDAAAINKRSGVIRYFSIIPSFPFDAELFDIVEQYLGNTDERTKLSREGDTVIKRLNNLIAEDSNYKFINNGVSAFVAIVNALKAFTTSLTSVNKTAYQQDKEAIDGLLNEALFKQVLLNSNNSKLSFEKLSELDILFRFQYRETLMKLLRYIYYIDVYISVARIAVENNFVFPIALEGNTHSMRVEGVYHPQLKGAVANNFDLTPAGNVVFLTGANMAGKSTFMKSLGTAMYLAHMGFPVAARCMEFTVMDGIYTTINLPDNLGSGTSHFYAEVLRVKKVAKELSLGKNLFVIIDELFRGTNVKDAYEATIAITAGFANKRNSMFVISTHIIEAGEVLKRMCENISFSYLPTLMDGNKPVYTYTLEKGITDDRHGMIIINNEGIIDLLKNGTKKTA